MIKILDQTVIDKIAAGEVVERPKSIVKELVENSIDAEATKITVEIRDGGKEYIRVTDNGCGIAADEIKLAVARHATSKLETAEELLGIKTLGFRGEALSTISAVTETEIITKTPDSITGIKYVIHGGQELSLEEIGAPNGTTIISKNLFYNIPARRKFLKTGMTESSYITDIMSRFALASPDISFKLINNDRTVIDTSGNGKLKDVIYSLYGKDITKNLLPVSFSEGDIAITGFVGKPFICKGNRSFETYFVNGRFIGSKVVNRAIEEAYKTFIMQHKFPFTVLYLSLPGERLDVNIHPSKQEFKYENEKELFSAVYHAVLNALKEKEIIPEYEKDYDLKVAERTAFMQESPAAYAAGNPNPGRNEAAPDHPGKVVNSSLGGDTGADVSSRTNTGTDMNGRTDTGADVNGRMTGHASVGNAKGNGNQNKGIVRTFTPSERESLKKMDMGSFSILEKMLPEDFRAGLRAITENEKNNTKPVTGYDNAGNNGTVDAANIGSATDNGMVANTGEAVNTGAVTNTGAEADSKNDEIYSRIVTGTQQELTDDNYLSKEALPKHKIIGLAFNTYWITEYMDELYIMDQHAAHEKVNYERFMKEFRERKVVSQNIYPPEIISLSPVEKQACLDNIELFEKSGFEISDFGQNDLRLTAVPVNLVGMEGRDVFLEFAAYLASGITGVTEDIFVRKIATMGCKAAVKGNQRISIQEVQALMDELMTLDNPYTCPHGRPTIIKVSKAELDKKFKRIVS